MKNRNEKPIGMNSGDSLGHPGMRVSGACLGCRDAGLGMLVWDACLGVLVWNACLGMQRRDQEW